MYVMPYASIIRADERVCARGEEQGVDFDLLSNVTYYATGCLVRRLALVWPGYSTGGQFLTGYIHFVALTLKPSQTDNFVWHCILLTD